LSGRLIIPTEPAVVESEQLTPEDGF